MWTAAAYRQTGDETAGWVPAWEPADIVPAARRDDAVLAARLAAELKAIAGADQRAFERFYDATLPRVFAVARRICRDPAQAEEVVEDTYVQVWRDAARFDPARGNALAWLLVMARSRALDALRRTDPAISVEDPHELLDDESLQSQRSDPLDLLDMLRRDSDIRSALATLPARDRQMVALAFLRGLTHAEIATEMQLPLGTVKTAIRRALVALRPQLAAHAPARWREGAGDEHAE